MLSFIYITFVIEMENDNQQNNSLIDDTHDISLTESFNDTQSL